MLALLQGKVSPAGSSKQQQLGQKHVKRVQNVQVERVWDRIKSAKLDTGGAMMNVVALCFPQVGCEAEETEDFWRGLEEVSEIIPKRERESGGLSRLQWTCW